MTCYCVLNAHSLNHGVIDMFKILPYKMGSTSAGLLATQLCCRRVYHDRNYRPSKRHVLINWGSGKAPDWDAAGCDRVINNFNNVKIAANKLDTLRIFSAAEVPHPEFSTNYRYALDWLNEGHMVVARHLLTDNSGAGIELLTKDNHGILTAPLYTKYQRKTHEYRVHVLPNGKVLLNQKRRNMTVSTEDVNWQVRNTAGGFIYAREAVTHNQSVVDAAVKAVEALGLDFGAADVIYHQPTGKVMVLEVNTAPGLAGSILNAYQLAFEELNNGY